MGDLEKIRPRPSARAFFVTFEEDGACAPKIRPPTCSLPSECRQGTRGVIRRPKTQWTTIEYEFQASDPFRYCCYAPGGKDLLALFGAQPYFVRPIRASGRKLNIPLPVGGPIS